MGACCSLCAWFSVIGAFTYGIMGIMLAKKNQSVIEHKFKLKFYDEDAISEA